MDVHVLSPLISAHDKHFPENLRRVIFFDSHRTSVKVWQSKRLQCFSKAVSWVQRPCRRLPDAIDCFYTTFHSSFENTAEFNESHCLYCRLRYDMLFWRAIKSWHESAETSKNYRTEPTTKSGKTEKLKSKQTDMLRSIGKQSGESVHSVLKKKRKDMVGRICRMKEWRVMEYW